MAERRLRPLHDSVHKELELDILRFILIDELTGTNQCDSRPAKRRKVLPMFANRCLEGAYEVLIKKHLKDNDTKFVEYFRLTSMLFNYILERIKPVMEARPYNRNKFPITAEQKLCITLRYLATGESFRSLAFQFQVHNSWISKIVLQCLQLIKDKFLAEAIPEPTREQFKRIAEDYFMRWHYPLCCGALDGKHIRIECPKNSGSLFFNYKEYFSIVLLALVDAQYKFIAIDVGSYGREGDAGIFLKSNLGKRFLSGQYNIPNPNRIPETDLVQEHVILGDEAFALHKNMMKPYSKTISLNDRKCAIYNYRHSRARRTSENSFGIMCSYFRIFFTAIKVKPETADLVVTVACILHNMMRDSKIKAPHQSHFNDVDIPFPRDNLFRLAAANHGRNNQRAAGVRNTFKDYFNGVGALSWQNQLLGFE